MRRYEYRYELEQSPKRFTSSHAREYFRARLRNAGFSETRRDMKGRSVALPPATVVGDFEDDDAVEDAIALAIVLTADEYPTAFFPESSILSEIREVSIKRASDPQPKRTNRASALLAKTSSTRR